MLPNHQQYYMHSVGMDPDYVIDSIEDGQGPSDPKVTYHKSACIVKCNPQGKIHLEGRVHDDYTGDLDEVGSSS